MSEKRECDARIVKRDMDALYLGNLKTVEFDLDLPRKGTYGSDIRWSSGEERFLTDGGKVSRPVYGMGNREVTLTGFFSKGEVLLKKEYSVTVLEQKNPEREPEVHRIDMEEQFDGAGGEGMVRECADARIRILPGNEFYDAQQRMRRYLLGVEDDRMLYHFRKAAGLDARGADSLDGWEAEESLIRGHTTGHYLSALALCYHAVGDEEIREKALYMVDELGACQEAFSKAEGFREGFLSGYSEEQFDLLEVYTPYPKIWAPYYTLHKIMAGLLDCYRYIGSEKALAIAEKMGVWTWKRLSRLPQAQREKMWGMYIAGEFGGMNEVMAQLGEITGREEFIECARLFDNDKLFGPLRKRRDCLTGIHANQHIPQILGAVELYKATGEKSYLDIARAFWTTVTRNRSYAPGGVGETEMFRGFREIGGLLTANTQESCASYNMLKLTRELYQIQPDPGYMDYYEKTLCNHILATLAEDDSGESTYFFPLGPGMRRTFLRENSCCHGTGMESHFRYREGIYYRSGKDLYINLYIPSELSYEDSDIEVRIEQTSKREQRYRILVRGGDLQNVYLRRPDWAVDTEVRAEGAEVLAERDAKGYIALSGDFREGRWIEVQWKPGFQILRAPDAPEKAALRYGPYILAALCEEEAFIHIDFDEGNAEEKMRWDASLPDDEIQFLWGGWKWVPVYQVGDLAYHVYVVCDR